MSTLKARLAHLLSGNETVLFVTDDQRWLHRQAIEPGDGGLQHRPLRVCQFQKLFGIELAREWPKS